MRQVLMLYSADYEGCLDALEMEAEIARHLLAQDQSLLNGLKAGGYSNAMLPLYLADRQSSKRCEFEVGLAADPIKC